MIEVLTSIKSHSDKLTKTKSLINDIKRYTFLGSIGALVLAFLFMFLLRPVGVALFILTLVGIIGFLGLSITDFILKRKITKDEDHYRLELYKFEHPGYVKKEKVVPLKAKVINGIKNFFSKPGNIILVIFTVLLSLMVLYPLVRLALNTFVIHGSFEADLVNEEWSTHFVNGDISVMEWPTLLFPKSNEMMTWSKTRFWTPLGRSFIMSVVACLIAVTFGGVLAWLITRSNMPFKKFISTIFIFPYIMPSWSLAMFWENFFKNSQCAASPGIGMLQSLTGICVPEGVIYGMIPCAIVLGLHYAPFAYILIGGILRNMDANLEEAATILKASRFKILRRITLPIVAPAMISTILLVFSSSLSTFTVPDKLKFTAISISLRSFLSTVGFHGFGYVVAVVLMIFSILILTLNNWFTKSRRNFTTVSGKSGQIAKTNLGKTGKWVIASITCIVVAFFAFVPLISFILETLEENSGQLNSITLKYWTSKEQFDTFIASKDFSTQGIFHNSTVWSSFGRSIAVALFVAFLAGTFGILIGYAVSKDRRGKLSNFVSSVAFLPYLIPALSFGAVFYGLTKTSAFSFFDVATPQLLFGKVVNPELRAAMFCVIIGAFKFLPFASRTGTNAMLQVSGEIEEAAVITGCRWSKRMTKILFPIQKSSFISGYLLPFISCMREYTLFILVTSQVTLITNTLSYFSINGLGQLSNAINLLIVVFVICANFLVNKLTGASIDKGIGG